MGRKPFRTPDEKVAIVPSALEGETARADVARRLGMSRATVARWQKQLLEGGREGLARGESAESEATRREEGLEDGVDELTGALGEAHAGLRVRRREGAPCPRSQTSSR